MLTAALIIGVVVFVGNLVGAVLEWRARQKTKPRRAILLRIVGKPEDKP